MPAGAQETFFYKHQAGDTYRIISTVTQDVLVNRRFSHSAEILNRISVEVTSETDGVGRHKATFQTSERAVSGTAGYPESFQWSREYDSEFDRDRLGHMNVGEQYFMPVVRNVPVFPDAPLQEGEKWTARGYEVHDFRDNFGITQPYTIPFDAEYEFLGSREWKGKQFPAFSVKYSISLQPPPARGTAWPRRITGNSDQIVFWDTEAGQPVAYSEEFRYIFELSDGRTVEFRGVADAEVIESTRMDREEAAKQISDEIDSLGIEDVSVRVVDEGVTLSLDNIQFYPDTAELLPGEAEKIERIAEILRRFPDRDILVGGHTALAGSQEGQQALSAQRASAVADSLINMNVRSPERIVVRGYGAERPLADNSTEEGRAKNRRVEITILEN